MEAGDYAAFGWLFDLWANIVLSLLAATEPVLSAISRGSKALVGAVGFAWLSLLFLRSADVGLIRGLIGGALIFACLTLGMQPTTFTAPGRSELPMLEIQSTPLKFALNVHAIYSSTLGGVLAAHTSASGSILPAQKAVDDAIERSAELYAGSDLARLIRDYNQQCAPAPSAVAGPGNATSLESYHAIGLLGGGGLGIPEESISSLAHLRTVAGSVWDRLAGLTSAETGVLDYAHNLVGGSLLDAGRRAWDLGTVRSRREQGVEALEQANRPFGAERPYSLPTQLNWAGVFAGKSESEPSYLRVADGPVGANTPLQDKEASISFSPRTCVEAYQVAQLAAEQAYRALESLGGAAGGAVVASTESGAISAGAAWQRLLSRSFSGTGEASEGGAGMAAGAMASFQMFKNWTSWLELQTLLPGYVVGLAGLFWLVLMIGPIALLIAPLRGVQTLISWFSLLIFPLLCLMFAHAITVAASLATAGIAVNQAATASGWMGAGADYDALRGALGAVGAVLLAASTWLASQLTGVNITGLAGSARGAISTTTDAAALVAKVAGTVALAGRLGGIGGSAAGRQVGGGGGSSGGNGGGVAPAPVPRSPAAPAAPARASAVATHAGISLVPARQGSAAADAIKSAEAKKLKAQGGFERLRRKIDRMEKGE